jgi:predicted glycosyltransferase
LSLVGKVNCRYSDAILPDYLPFGVRYELKGLLSRIAAKKYFVLRGVIDSSDREFLSGESVNVIGDVYDRILVTADKRIVDVASEYCFGISTSSKLFYTGFVAPQDIQNRFEVRAGHRVPDGLPWVVCSGGGGLDSEELLWCCTQVAEQMPNVWFDIVFGPRSRGRTGVVGRLPANCHVARESQQLADMHTAADVVVSAGGYNTLVECAIGGAHIIVRPSRSGADDEQTSNAIRLSSFYPVRLLQDDSRLREMIETVLRTAVGLPRPTFGLDTDGVKRIREILLSDLECNG